MPQLSAQTAHEAPRRLWRPRSVALLLLAWAVLQLGGIVSPGLLDDVDSIYIEIAREMLVRRDFVTPYVNGIRFFDKPPLMYWMAAGSMRLFGVHDWAARLPLALAVLALLLSVYALGNRLFRATSPAAHPDRGGFYAALALATSIGPYLYTRFYIPDIVIALWMTLSVHCFLIALERASERRSTLLPAAGFAATIALNVLTKGLIGVVFPLGFVLVYLALTGQLRLARRLHPILGTAVLLAIAAPWHILAALRNPAIALPAGIGLPARGGWAWFYLYNEHIARFLSKRIPHDYGQTPVWLFWLYLGIWAMPWAAFLPSAIALHWRTLRQRAAAAAREHEAALTLLLWAALVLGFFSLSARQEYYSLPAIPALALMAGGLLARAEAGEGFAVQAAQRWSLWLLAPVTTLVALVCAWFAIMAPRPAPGATLDTLLASNPDLYNLSLGHIFDLTSAAMGLFRGPLTAVAIGMLTVGLGSTLLRAKGRMYAANLTIAAGMIVTLLAAHTGLVRFNPILGSKGLAETLNSVRQPGDLIVLDGEFTSGSTLVFYTGQQVHLVNGRVNTLWYGSFWPASPQVFESEASLDALWSGPRRIFLLTYAPAARERSLAAFGTVRVVASAGGKTLLTNR